MSVLFRLWHQNHIAQNRHRAVPLFFDAKEINGIKILIGPITHRSITEPDAINKQKGLVAG